MLIYFIFSTIHRVPMVMTKSKIRSVITLPLQMKTEYKRSVRSKAKGQKVGSPEKGGIGYTY